MTDRSNRFSTAMMAVCCLIVGCERSKPVPTLSIRPDVPLSVRPSETPTRVFSSTEEIPTTFTTFEGARGSVRVTLEVEGTSGNGKLTPLSLNDVLFQAIGEGRISLTIKRPWPDHPNGRVTIGCRSAGEESSADFEPELWFHKEGAIITFESIGGEASSPVMEGKEVILGRYLARNLPQDIRVTLRAMFSKDPAPPRTNAGPKPKL